MFAWMVVLIGMRTSKVVFQNLGKFLSQALHGAEASKRSGNFQFAFEEGIREFRFALLHLAKPVDLRLMGDQAIDGRFERLQCLAGHVRQRGLEQSHVQGTGLFGIASRDRWV